MVSHENKVIATCIVLAFVFGYSLQTVGAGAFGLVVFFAIALVLPQLYFYYRRRTENSADTASR